MREIKLGVEPRPATIVPESRPLSGAAATPGPEAALAKAFIDHAVTRWDKSILAPEVPLRDGVADLIRIQARVDDIQDALLASRRLAELDDRLLYRLASFRPNQRYLLRRLIGSSSDQRTIGDLAKGGWIDVDAVSLIRHRHLVDEISNVTAYEFKTRDNHAGLRQAALRRTAVTKSYLVTYGIPNGAFPSRSEFSRLGVGWVSLEQRLAHRIAAAHSASPRWARYLILRGIARGLERELLAHRTECPQPRV